MKEHSDYNSQAGEGRQGKHHGVKKKEEKHNKQQSIANEFFMGVGFCIGREGPELYTKTMERLGLYVSSQFKNGSDVKNA